MFKIAIMYKVKIPACEKQCLVVTSVLKYFSINISKE